MNPENWYIKYDNLYKELYEDIKPTCILFGGSGGIGSYIEPILNIKYDTISLGSKDLDLLSRRDIDAFLKKHNPSIIIYLVGTNYNSSIINIENIDEYIDVNIKSYINVLSSSMNLMKSNNYGRFIYISSILSNKFVYGTALYSSMKKHNENITIAAAKENGKYNITSNVIRLGYFNVGMIKDVPDNVLNDILSQIPTKKLGDPKQITNVIDTIIENDYINGSIIDINGAIR